MPLIEIDTPAVIPVFGLRISVGAITVNGLLAESLVPAAINVTVPETGKGGVTSGTVKVPEVPA